MNTINSQMRRKDWEVQSIILRNKREAKRLYGKSNSNNYWMNWRKNERAEREYQPNLQIRCAKRLYYAKANP